MLQPPPLSSVPPPTTPSESAPLTARSILGNITENERIVHQLLAQQGSLAATFNQDLHDIASTDPDVAFRLAVHAQASRAYWDLVAESLTAPRGSPQRVIAALGTLRQRLLDLVPGGGPRSQQLRAAINDALDQGFAEVVTALQAAAHVPASPTMGVACTLSVEPHGTVAVSLVSAWGVDDALASAVAGALRFVGDKVDEVTMDVVRVRLEMLQSLLNTGGNGIDYARRRYQRAVEAAGSVPAALPVTTQWLAAADVASAKGAVAAGLVALLQHPQAMQGPGGVVAPACPETLVLEAGRITMLQNELQRLSLTASIMLTATNALHAVLEAGSCPTTQMEAPALAAQVRARFLVLLSQQDVGMASLEQELTALVAQHAQQCSSMDAALAHELAQPTCAAMLSAVLKPDSAIYARVQAGLCAALTAGLHASPTVMTVMDAPRPTSPGKPDVRNATAGVQEHARAHVRGVLLTALAPVGAAALVGEVGDWVLQAQLVLELTWAVCGPWYEALWRARGVLAAEA